MEDSVDCRQFCEKVLSQAKKLGADYADMRIVRRDNESISLRTGKVEGLNQSSSYGFNVRVLLDGAWGFASSPIVTDEAGGRIAEEAVRIARASARVKIKDVKLAPVEVHEGSFKTDWKINPFDVSLDEKIAYLKDADEVLRQDPKVKVTDSFMEFFKFDQVFASTEGAYIEQTRIESGAGISATAIENSEVQTRSYPGAFGGDYAAEGYEFVQSLEMLEHAQEVRSEAVALLDAPVCPAGPKSLILQGSILALQVHESCGHPVELDRVFGMESSFAGTSFLTPEKLNCFRYGSDLVNMTADATIPGGLGSFSFDDEGVPGQCFNVVEDGIFKGYLSSRETAIQLGQRSTGAMRSVNWNYMPIIRMTNVSLMPGDWSFDELIADTPDGIYAADVKSWSIDDKRLNFLFGTEIAWEIKDGSLGRILKNPIYSGMTPEFWGSCDAICGQDDWHLYGVPNCGKGEPAQLAHVGNGAAPSRFTDVRMGGAK
ncbi:MAG: TldD/PmbA family protein [Armatimonadota bacterium]